MRANSAFLVLRKIFFPAFYWSGVTVQNNSKSVRHRLQWAYSSSVSNWMLREQHSAQSQVNQDKNSSNQWAFGIPHLLTVLTSQCNVNTISDMWISTDHLHSPISQFNLVSETESMTIRFDRWFNRSMNAQSNQFRASAGYLAWPRLPRGAKTSRCPIVPSDTDCLLAPVVQKFCWVVRRCLARVL